MMFWQGQPFYSRGRIFLRGEKLKEKMKIYSRFSLIFEAEISDGKSIKKIDLWSILEVKMSPK